MNTLNTAIFYTCGTCNLNCNYCLIDKSPILKEIDMALEKSFLDDQYYIGQIKKMFPDPSQLKRIETWGGEPFFKMDRIYNLLHQIIENYPYFSEMFSSTNFSYDIWVDQFFGLMNQFKQYEYRDFEYTLQLSLDGPSYINDINRGEGVTEKCLANFYKLIDKLALGELPENITLHIAIKATLDLNSLNILNNKENIIKYYQFFENRLMDYFYSKIDNPKKIIFHPPQPNTAVPGPETKADGEMFANICKLCREIEKENINKKYFKYYNIITFFSNNNCHNLTYHTGYCGCGSGVSHIGFLPNGMYSTCHEGFTHFIAKYKDFVTINKNKITEATVTFNSYLKEQKNSMCVDDIEWNNYVEKMKKCNNGSTIISSILATEIINLAMADQIDKQYLSPKKALEGALFILCHSAYCFKNNYNETGSLFLHPVGIIKLFLNGAKEYIENNNGENYDDIEKF